jgi:hypothetical protein
VIDVRWGHEVDARPNVFRGSDRVRYRNLPLMPDQAVPEGIAATYRHNVRHPCGGRSHQSPGALVEPTASRRSSAARRCRPDRP